MKFKTAWNGKEWTDGMPDGEEFSDEYLVEKGGYIPLSYQIESMIAAGKRLDDFRYDELYGDEDEDQIPFEVPDDIADAYEKARTAAQRFKVRKKEYAVYLAEKEQQEALREKEEPKAEVQEKEIA